MELDFLSENSEFECYEDKYLDLMKLTLNTLGLTFNPIVSVTIVNNKHIHRINHKYRDVDRPTDVISFAFLDGNKQRDTIFHSQELVPLGDIYISYEKAIEQAQEYGHPLEREMSFLFVHGLLHLLGYDHMTKEDEEVMFKLQEEILNQRKRS